VVLPEVWSAQRPIYTSFRFIPSLKFGRRGDPSPFHSGSNSAFSPEKVQACPRGCPTPCVLLVRMNTFIDLFFHALLFIAVLSTGLLIAELRGTMRR